jgi:hypothetical protein
MPNKKTTPKILWAQTHSSEFLAGVGEGKERGKQGDSDEGNKETVSALSNLRRGPTQYPPSGQVFGNSSGMQKCRMVLWHISWWECDGFVLSFRHPPFLPYYSLAGPFLLIIKGP